MNSKFYDVIKIFPDSLRIPLNSIKSNFSEYINEIRIRSNRPVTVYTSDDWYYIDQMGNLSKIEENLIIATADNIEETFYNSCNKSVYAHLEDVKNGFLTLEGGHRIGFCGTYIYENGIMVGQKAISSINIRIAREVLGCSDALDAIFKNGLKNILICGPPQCGKTTVLRDIIRKVSSGIFTNQCKVVVIDERGEISALHNSVPQNCTGVHTDIIGFSKKKDGIVNAIRSLSPDLIACDELGSDEDINALFLCSTCGVRVVATIHCFNKYDLVNKKIFEDLPLFFDYFVFLEGIGSNSRIKEILYKDELM